MPNWSMKAFKAWTTRITKDHNSKMVKATLVFQATAASADLENLTQRVDREEPAKPEAQATDCMLRHQSLQGWNKWIRSNSWVKLANKSMEASLTRVKSNSIRVWMYLVMGQVVEGKWTLLLPLVAIRMSAHQRTEEAINSQSIRASRSSIRQCFMELRTYPVSINRSTWEED